jgi:hypothetical protein
MVDRLIFPISDVMVGKTLKIFLQYIGISYSARMYDLKQGKIQRTKGECEIFRCCLKLVVSEMTNSLPTGQDTTYIISFG